MISYKKRAVEGYRNLVKKEINHTSTLFAMGDSRKNPYHYKGGFLEFRGQGGVLWTGNPKAWENTYDWNSEGIGGGGGTGG